MLWNNPPNYEKARIGKSPEICRRGGNRIDAAIPNAANLDYDLQSNGESKLSEIRLEPFLKWAGGKRWLVSSHSHIFPTRFNRFIEPFLGSGAVFFSLQPKQAILSDINSALIETYQAIKDSPNEIRELLAKHHRKHSKEYYYKMRAMQPRTNATKAAKFIYLNRTCWNGLYRVNLRGEFNVPIGTKTNVILDSDNFESVSKLLENAELNVCDFETTINQAVAGDLVFVDPPYSVKHNNNGFVKYNETLFSWDDQVRLRDSLVEAKKRGATIIVTNANHSSILDLYRNIFDISTVSRHSVLSGNRKFRGKVSELIISANLDGDFHGG